MNKITTQLKKISIEKRMGLMTHIVTGYPDLDTSLKLVEVMAKAGVDFVEMQIPFSDPMADGPTIMSANKIALENATTTVDALEAMKLLSDQVQIPLLFMGYFNLIYNFGIEKFCAEAANTGASGLIFPDISLEEGEREGFDKSAAEHDLEIIRVLSPSSTDQRIKLNAKRAGGFVYLTAHQGTTGARTDTNKLLAEYIVKLKQQIKLPVAVGFGISSPEHIQEVKQAGADIAVVGSAVINTYNKTKSVAAVREFVESLVEVL